MVTPLPFRAFPEGGAEDANSVGRGRALVKTCPIRAKTRGAVVDMVGVRRYPHYYLEKRPLGAGAWGRENLEPGGDTW